MADIEGMFMQVGVRAQDRRYLGFLWTNNEFEEPEVYEYQRHIFGAKDSPTCAIYALQQTAQDHKTEFPAASEAVFEDFYMDDFIKSVNDVEEALTMQRNMRQLLLKGSFNLTKWCSNENTFCQKLPQDLLAKPIEKLFHHESIERILCVKWSPFEDSIGTQITKFDCFEGTLWTQRKALSLIAKIFDPFGLISTFTITMKIQLQDIWKNGQMWDKPLEEAAEQTLTRTLRDMPQLADFKIPRYIGSTLNRNVQLHIFCDASKVATAVSAYLRITDVYGKTRLVVILGKTRVAPIKQQTIPKLELQASVYASRLRKNLTKN